MAVVESWVPVDSFGARLALVRQYLGGWNVKRTAQRCGIDEQSWRNWEQGAKPRDLIAACRQISDATDVDYAWLALGGPLRSKCSSGFVFDLELSA